MSITLSTLGSFMPEPGTNELPAAPGFGIRTDGTCYLNPDGAAGGEAAWVRLTATGKVKLVLQATQRVGLEEGDARTVELDAPVTAPIIEKDGMRVLLAPAKLPAADDGAPVTIAAPVTLELHYGRPAAVGAPVTAAIREKPGVTPVNPTHTPLVLRSGRPVELAPPVTLSTQLRTRPAVSTPRGCRRCGAAVPKRGLCDACRAQADLRQVVRLRNRGLTPAVIVRETGLPAPRVKHLLAKSRRGRTG